MEILAYIILAFAVIQLIVAMANTIFRSTLPTSGSSDSLPLISVLIPARNESERIGNLLDDLINQEYANLEIIVFNDQSTNDTENIVQQYTKKDDRIRLIHSDDLPDCWLGKNYACHSMSQLAKGQYFLFLDADVRVGKKLIHNSLNYIQKNNLQLLSIFPHQIMVTPSEKATVPVMNYILLTLLLLVLVRTSKYPSLSAANGQFMMFEAQSYQTIWPHNLFKNNKVEDIAIARHYKSLGQKVGCLVGDKNIQCRMYNGFNESVNGFSKNVTAFFGHSFLIAILFWTFTTLGVAGIGSALQLTYLFIYLVVIIATRILVSISSKQSWAENLLYLVPQQISLGIFIYKAFINQFKAGYTWKGRKIS